MVLIILIVLGLATFASNEWKDEQEQARKDWERIMKEKYK